MRNIFIIILFLLLSSSLIGASKNISIFQNGKVIAEFTPDEYIKLVEGAGVHAEELDAEKSNRVLIEVVDTPYKVAAENSYHAQFKLTWTTKDGKVIKSITMESDITISESSTQVYPAWRVTYRDVAEIGFPVVSGMFLVVVLILAL